MKTLMPFLLLLTMSIVPCMTARAEIPIPENPRWTPVADAVYLQDTSLIVATDAPVLSAAVYQGALYTGSSKGVARLDEDKLTALSGPKGEVTRLKVLRGNLYAATDKGLWRYDGKTWTGIGDQPVADMCAYRDGIVVASGKGVYRVEGAGLALIAETRNETVEGVAVYSGAIYVRHPKRIGLVVDGRLEYDDVSDWGDMPTGAVTHDILADGSRLLVATDEGLAVLRGMTWYAIQGEDGLCYEDTTTLALGFGSDLWIGTQRGAIRNVDDDYDYYGYARWIPDDHVNAIAVSENTAYIATDSGLGIVGFEPYTLRKKAAWYERWLNEWGMKRLGFVNGLNMQNGEWVRGIGDNDVGYTCHYLAAKCFEYAVTKDPAAKAAAIDVFKTVKWSEEITTVPGFPARSIWAVGDTGTKASTGSGGLPAEWHATPDGLFEWKGDTSSDETDAHVYAVSVFLELVAEGAERDMAIEHLARVFGHIVDNGWVLRDVDGEPTRWARWDPAYLQSPYGFYARGLNGMEALSYATTAYHFTQDEKFRAGKNQLIEWGYPNEVLRQKLTFHPGYYTDFDDRLAFLAYYPLIQYETDPDLKTLWLRSLERSWEVKRMEHAPWYAYLYAGLTGNDCENEEAVEHLRDWPLDLVTYSQFNSHRDDISTPKGYRNYGERIKALSPREVGPKRQNRDFAELDIDHKGAGVADPSGWLETYWMGRYYGLIEAPTATDPAVLTVPERNLQLGAKPYAGPPRPQLPIN